MDSRLYWIWLQQKLKPGCLFTHKLLRDFGDAKTVFLSSEKDLWDAKLPNHIVKNLADKDVRESEHILSLSLEKNGWILTPNDEYFSSWLKSIPALPLVIYGRGNMPNLDIVPAITIVGTRESTQFGRTATKMIAGGLASGGMVVISGGARGIDSIAHKSALDAGGVTVAVQGCGLDVNYPKENEQMRLDICGHGAIITEYPPGTKPLGSNFPVRNRIMSGLSIGVCIMEAPKRSGALITARHALDQGRDVFAAAGDMIAKRSQGTDALIQNGAMLINDAKDILSQYTDRYGDVLTADIPKNLVFAGGDTSARPASPARKYTKKIAKTPKPTAKNMVAVKCADHVSNNAKKVYGFLADKPVTLSSIVAKSGLSASQTMTALTELELAGCAKSGAGQAFSLVYEK